MSLHSSSIVRFGLACLLCLSGGGARCMPARAGKRRPPTASFRARDEGASHQDRGVPGGDPLTTARDRQSIVVQATFADGITRDVTREATITPADSEVAQARRGDLLPGGRRFDDAVGRAMAASRSAMPVKVSQATVQSPLSFRLDVMPVFMRAGCNTGSCHGAARGKDGFRISLFGFDPEGDYFRLTREMVGRRINLAVPSDSTLITKATGAVNHTGGKRFESSSELYQTLHGWIEAGARQGRCQQGAHGGGRRPVSPARGPGWQGLDPAAHRPGSLL